MECRAETFFTLVINFAFYSIRLSCTRSTIEDLLKRVWSGGNIDFLILPFFSIIFVLKCVCDPHVKDSIICILYVKVRITSCKIITNCKLCSLMFSFIIYVGYFLQKTIEIKTIILFTILFHYVFSWIPSLGARFHFDPINSEEGIK